MEVEMIADDALTKMISEPSIDVTFKIIAEMDQLLEEMKETMSIIKDMLGENTEGHLSFASSENKNSFNSQISVIHRV
jgi:hypothetical protein